MESYCDRCGKKCTMVTSTCDSCLADQAAYDREDQLPAVILEITPKEEVIKTVESSITNLDDTMRSFIRDCANRGWTIDEIYHEFLADYK